MNERFELLLGHIAAALDRLADIAHAQNRDGRIATALERIADIEQAALELHRARHPTVLELDKAALAGWTRPPTPPVVIDIGEMLRNEIAQELAARDRDGCKR
jgi:hypothetical protein